MKIFFDKFVSKHLGITSHLIILDSKASNLKLKNKIESLKKNTPILITIKSNYKLTKNMSKKLNAKYVCDQITFQREHKKNIYEDNFCRQAIKKDKKKLQKISLENSSMSHYVQNTDLPIEFRKKFRFHWLNNYFKNQRGDYLIVSKKLEGYILLLQKKNTFIIDLIAVSKKSRKKGIAKSLINYVNDNFLQKNMKLIAGTNSNNFGAINFYKKMEFKLKKKIRIYHIYTK